MNSHKKKMIAPVIVTFFMVLYYIAYFGFLASVLDGVCKVLFGLVPIVFATVMVKVCLERIEEIKGGEEDDLSQY